MINYTVELFTLTDLTEVVSDLLQDNEHVKSVWFESHPNKEHNSIMVEIQLTEEQDEDVEYFEEVVDSIERVYYSLDEVYESYNQFYYWRYVNDSVLRE